jgi:hypothetical protein
VAVETAMGSGCPTARAAHPAAKNSVAITTMHIAAMNFPQFGRDFKIMVNQMQQERLSATAVHRQSLQHNLQHNFLSSDGLAPPVENVRPASGETARSLNYRPQLFGDDFIVTGNARIAAFKI